MTSGNVSDEPIAKDNDEARERLGAIADAFLLHDRDIYARYDNSVVRVVDGREHVVRRARGYCPLPVEVDAAASSPPRAGARRAPQEHVLHPARRPRLRRSAHRRPRPPAEPAPPRRGADDVPAPLPHRRRRTVAADLHPDYASTHIAERWWDGGAARGTRPAPPRPHRQRHGRERPDRHGSSGSPSTAPASARTAPSGAASSCSATRPGSSAPATSPPSSSPAATAARARAGGWRSRTSTPRGVDAERDPGVVRRRRARRAPLAPGRPPRRRGCRPGGAGEHQRGPALRRGGEPPRRRPHARASRRRQRCGSRRWRARSRPGRSRRSRCGAAAARSSSTRTSLVAALVEQRAAGPGRRRAGRRLPREPRRRGGGGVRATSPAATGVDRVALSGGVFQNALLLQRTSAHLRERGLHVYTNHAGPRQRRRCQPRPGVRRRVAGRHTHDRGGHDGGGGQRPGRDRRRPRVPARRRRRALRRRRRVLQRRRRRPGALRRDHGGPLLRGRDAARLRLGRRRHRRPAQLRRVRAPGAPRLPRPARALAHQRRQHGDRHPRRRRPARRLRPPAARPRPSR